MKNYYKKTVSVLWIILAANFFVSAIKLIIGSISGCASLFADGLHSFSDGASNIIGIIGICFASQPEDKKHPYGHQKFEILASLFIGIMLFFICIKIASEGISTLIHPQSLSFHPIEIIAVLTTILINISVSLTEYRLGRKWKSSVLVSDSIHTRSDILISSGVLLGIIGIKAGLPLYIDGIISLFISVLIAFSCFKILYPAVCSLVDTNIADYEAIKSEVSKFKEVKGIHKIKSRGSENNIFIEMHILVDENYSVGFTHVLSHKIENSLKIIYGDNTHVNIHVEPYCSSFKEQTIK